MKAANDNSPLGKIYSLDEAAELLTITKFTLAKMARRTGLCSKFGRKILFSESDVLAIWDEARCPSQNSDAEKSGISGEPLLSGSEANLSMKAQAFLTKGKRKSSASARKAA